jgi:4-amino-4-deoxy-L-arabinose transferase-like glycosyltransferase
MPDDLPRRAAAVLLALVLGLLVFRLGAVPLVGPDEPRYTRVAVEMHRAGEWVRPTLQGEPWLEKPPLFYWLAGGAFSILGETEAAARLPSVLAGLLLVGATALLGARLHGGAAGLHAGFVAGTSLLTFVPGRAASMDMLLAATTTVATTAMPSSTSVSTTRTSRRSMGYLFSETPSSTSSLPLDPRSGIASP